MELSQCCGCVRCDGGGKGSIVVAGHWRPARTPAAMVAKGDGNRAHHRVNMVAVALGEAGYGGGKFGQRGGR